MSFLIRPVQETVLPDLLCVTLVLPTDHELIPAGCKRL